MKEQDLIVFAVSFYLNSDEKSSLRLTNGMAKKREMYENITKYENEINDTEFRDCLLMLNSNFIILKNNKNTNCFEVNLNCEDLNSKKISDFIEKLFSEVENYITEKDKKRNIMKKNYNFTIVDPKGNNEDLKLINNKIDLAIKNTGFIKLLSEDEQKLYKLKLLNDMFTLIPKDENTISIPELEKEWSILEEKIKVLQGKTK